MVWVDNAFGRGGKEAMTEALAAHGIEIVADLKTAPEQRDFTEVAAKVRASGAGAAFVYLNEQESADCLRALFDEAYGGWIVGETTLVGQKVGKVGTTGNSTGCHLHFELWVGAGWYTGGGPIDPLPLLQYWDSYS